MNSKNIRGLSKRATYQGLIGQIIGTPLGTYAGYKGVSKLTDNKALRILGAIAGGIAGNRLGDYAGDMLNEKRMQQRKKWEASTLGPKDVSRLVEQSYRDRTQSARLRMQLSRLSSRLKNKE